MCCGAAAIRSNVASDGVTYTIRRDWYRADPNPEPEPILAAVLCATINYVRALFSLAPLT